MYYSNGITWSFLNVPYQATQEEVDAGTVTDKFVTPNTFANSGSMTRLANTSGTNTGNETQSTIGALIDATELAEITDTTKIAASDSAFLKWFSGLRIKNYLTGFFAKLSGGNTFSGKQDFDGMINYKAGEYFYTAASKTTDTVNDTRVINSAGVEIHSVCTGNGVTKGSGTWVTLYNIGDSHGFISPPNNDNFTITNIGDSITLTLLPNAGDYKINSKLYKNTGLSLNFTATAVGQYFININNSGLFKDTGISIEDLTKIPCATINWDGTNAVLADELHKASRNLAQHQKEHDTDGARWVSGLATTFGAGASNTFSASSGVIRDEERYHSIGAKTQCRISYRNAGLTAMITDAPSTAFAKLNGGIARYDNNGVLTYLPNNQYGTYYMYATNRKLPINSELVCVMGQGSYSTIALAQAAPQPTLAGMTVAEWKLMYVIIVRRTAALPFGFIQADDKRLVTTGLAVSGSGITSLPAASITETNFGNVQNAIDNLKVEAFGFAMSDNTSDLTSGVKISAAALPYNFTLTGVRAQVGQAATGALLTTLDVKVNTVSVFSTKPTFDSGETITETATTPYVLTASTIPILTSDTVELSVFLAGGVTQAAKNLTIYLIGYKTI